MGAPGPWGPTLRTIWYYSFNDAHGSTFETFLEVVNLEDAIFLARNKGDHIENCKECDILLRYWKMTTFQTFKKSFTKATARIVGALDLYPSP